MAMAMPPPPPSAGKGAAGTTSLRKYLEATSLPNPLTIGRRRPPPTTTEPPPPTTTMTNPADPAVAAAAAPSVRPYTSYNFFFQLQREYILQVVHGVRPSIAPSDVFDPEDRANYQGPPLPARFRDLVLPSDWHIPGKARRRKRSHRRTHGKIGFHELNDQISRAWNAADDETRDFCTKLAEAEAKKYHSQPGGGRSKGDAALRRSLKKAKSRRRNSEALLAGAFATIDLSDPFSWSLESPEVRNPVVVGRAVSHSGSDLARSGGRTSLHSSATSGAGLRDSIASTLAPQSLQGSATSAGLRDSTSSTVTEVDMGDGEILAMWKSITIREENVQEQIRERVCVEIPGGLSPPPPFSAARSAPADNAPAPSGTPLPRSEEPRGARRRSLIDTADGRSLIENEYEMYRELGKTFSRSARPAGLPTELERKVFAASLA